MSRSACVATVLLPGERKTVEAAGVGCFTAVHGESLDDAMQQARRQAVDAMVLSVSRCGDADLPRVARFVREFPHVPAFALVTAPDPQAMGRVLRLGATGVHAVVDVCAPSGWQRLRELLYEPTSPIVARVMAEIDRDLAGVPPDCRLFFELVVRRAGTLATVDLLAAELRVVPSSLMSRFQRAGLPSPKTYLAHGRLLYAAWLLGNDGISISDVAHRLQYSSPQAFGRHLRALLGITAGEFRRRFPFDVSVARYRHAFITPFRERLLTFHPLGTTPGDHGHPSA